MDDIKNIVCKNSLNSLFFSDDNIKIIQNALRRRVYMESGHLISCQSKRELTIVMRSVYLMYSKNQKTNITQQIDTLNQIVVKECVPKVISNIKQYLNYKKNVHQVPLPLSLPKNMSKSGKNTYSLTQF